MRSPAYPLNQKQNRYWGEVKINKIPFFLSFHREEREGRMRESLPNGRGTERHVLIKRKLLRQAGLDQAPRRARRKKKFTT